RHPATAVDPAGTDERPLVVRLGTGRQHGDVAGAVRHRRDQPAPRLHAVRLGHVYAHGLGLGHACRLARPLLHALPGLCAHAPRDLDGGNARAFMSYVARFTEPQELLSAARQAYRAGYRRLDAFSPSPAEEPAEAL